MKADIKETVQGTWLVNGVEVYETSEGKYEAKGLLLDEERKQFLEHIKKNDSKKLFSDLELLKTELQNIERKLILLKRQKEIIDNRKDTFSDEALKLRNYYHRQINKYEVKKQAITNQLSVNYKTVS